MGDVELGQADTAVYQQKLGCVGELGNGRCHCQFVGRKNADLINNAGGLLANAIRQGVLANQLEEAFTFFGGELFGIVYAVEQGCNLVVERQNDGGGHHRASQCAAPRFINASDVGEVVLLGNGRFQRE